MQNTNGIANAPLTSSKAVNKILFELKSRLYDMNGAALYLMAAYDKSAVIVKNLRQDRNVRQIDPMKVEELRRHLELIGVEARQLYKDVHGNVARLHDYRLRLHEAFPKNRTNVDAYFNEMMKLRKNAERNALEIANKAPARAREIQGMAGRGFGNYMSGADVVTSRGTISSEEVSADRSVQAPPTENTVTRQSRIDQLLAEKLGKDKSSVVIEEDSVSKEEDSVSKEEQEELDAFLQGAGVADGVNMPPLMVDPSEAEETVSGYSEKSSEIPPLMVIETGEVVAEKPAPIVKSSIQKIPSSSSSSAATVKAPVVTAKPSAVAVKTVTKEPVDDDGGFGGFNDEGEKPVAEQPEVKKPEVKKPEVKKPEVKQPVKVDNDFDSFGGFDDEEPAKTSTEKPAVKSSEPTKVDPKKPTGEGNDEFEGFMDFDEGFVPLDKTSDVAMGSRVPSFSERIAAEFKRQGISEGVAAPPVRSVTKQDSPVNHQSFATSLKSELAEGLPSDRELLPEEHSTIIASLLDFSDNGDSDPREANDASKAEKPSYSGNGKIQQLLNQLNSFK
jgi:hypothetical protein